MNSYAERGRRRLGIAIAVGLLVWVPLIGQSQTAATKTTAAPDKTWRTPWGDPDLQGSWTNATNTPLQRPAKYGTREFLTLEERAEADKPRRDVERGERGATPEEDVAGAYNQFWREERLSDGRTSLVVDPPDGRIPMTPAGQARRAAFSRDDGVDSWEDRNLYDRCIMRNPLPRIPSAYNNNYEIVQTPGYVAILQEIMHDTRVIPLDGRPHLDASVRQWLGDSRGRWEGNTLVVETTNFSDRTDFEGAGPNMRLVERWTRLADDRIDYRFTVEDPTAWTRPWSAVIGWNKVEPLFEYACHEGNYSLYNILEGARVAEAAARTTIAK
jgi:hypothetical protein